MKKFDLVIIGGGVAGLVAASGASQLGARVALIDRTSLGGDCLRTGCVPTKSLLYSAKVASMARRAAEFGVETGSVKADFRKVIGRMRAVQEELGRRDDPERFRKMGVEVIIGSGHFMDTHIFEVNGERLLGRKYIIATGSSPVMPPIPGLKESGALTNETVLKLKDAPGSVAILGAGPIGMEFSQIFRRLGSEVTVIEKQAHILSREDPEISGMLKGILESEGVKIDVCTDIKDVGVRDKKKIVSARCPTGDRTYAADEVMAAIGRSPNLEGLNLEAAGVAYDRKGVKVDEHLQTSQRHIYACGDCIGQFAFTHVAEHHAGVALGNALFPFIKRKVDYRAVPWTTFTDPELARVGLTEAEAKDKYGAEHIRVYRHLFKDTDRAVIEGETAGMIKLVTDRKKRILGAHILGPRAGELIHEYALAIREGIPVSEVSRTIHVYPTLSMANKRVSDEYYRERLFKGRLPRITRWLIRRLGGI